MYELYIKGKKVDLPNNFSISWTFNATDLSTPSAIKNNFSKQIELDGTPNNNIIFNYLYKIDSDYVSSFNPNIRNEFVLTNNGTYIESGYVQLNKITNTLSGTKYAITLFGGLGDFFYNLDKDEDGNKKTLSSLHWKWVDTISLDDNWWTDDRFGAHHNILTKEQEDNQLIFSLSPKSIVLSWKELGYPEDIYTTIDGQKYTNVRNDIIMMPFDSGKPDIDSFDATKVLIDVQIYNNNLNQYWKTEWDKSFPNVVDGVTYYSKNLYDNYNEHIGKFVLAEAQRDISQLETGMLINTQMIPGLRIKKFLDVISDPENNGGYEVEFKDSALTTPATDNRGYMLLDRIKSDDLNLAFVVKDDVTSRLMVNWKGETDIDATTPIHLINGDLLDVTQLQALGIDHFEWSTERNITTTAQVMIGGFVSPIPNTAGFPSNPRNGFFAGPTTLNGFIITPQYESTHNSGSGHDWIKNIYGCNAHVTTQFYNFTSNFTNKMWKTDTSTFDSFNPSSGQGNNQLDPNNRNSKLCNPVSFTVRSDSNGNVYPNDRQFLEATIYLNILRATDVNNTKEVVYVHPWILANNIDYKAEDARDPNTYTYNIPNVIYNWLISTDFKNKLTTYINNLIANDGYTTVSSIVIPDVTICYPWHHRLYEMPTPQGSKYINNIHRNINNRNPMSLLKTDYSNSDAIFASQNFKLNISQTLSDKHNVYFDFNDLSQLGSQFKFSTEYTWCNAVYNNDQHSMDYGTTIKAPQTNYPTNYFWLPASFWQCTDNRKYHLFNTPDKLASVGAMAVHDNPGNAYIIRTSSGAKYNFSFIHKTTEKTIFPELNAKLMESYTTKKGLLNNTNSPYEYFISLAKLLNWRFEYDAVLKKIVIMGASEYYNNYNPNPLTIDYGHNIEITPYLMDVSTINLSTESIDSYANYLYNKKTDNIFNSHDIPNKYSFNDKTENLLNKVVFKSGAEYMPISPMFTEAQTYCPITKLGGTTTYRYFTEADDGNYKTEEIIPRVQTNTQNILFKYDYPMLCCYDDDYNYVSPKNIIVYLNGFISNTRIPQNYPNTNAPVFPTYFGITAFTNNISKLNDGNPCYVNNYYYDMNAQQDCPWARVNSISVWPSDIPHFSLYNFLSYDHDSYNGELIDKSNALLFNPDNYYSTNPDYLTTLRLKSRANDYLGNAPYEPFETFPLTYTTSSTYSQYPFDCPRQYDLGTLNTFVANANTLNTYTSEIANITDQNARQIKLKARLNASPKKSLQSIYTLNGGKYLISKIENYDVSQSNPFADITLQKIINV